MVDAFGGLITWLVLIVSGLVVPFGYLHQVASHAHEVRRDLDVYVGPQIDWSSHWSLYRGDTVRVHARTSSGQTNDVSARNTWLEVSRGAWRGWISARDLYVSEDQLSRIPESTMPPFTVTADAAVLVRADPAETAATVFEAPAGLPLHVVGRSDDGGWIAIRNPEPFDARHVSSPSRGWLPADAVTPAWGRLQDLPYYLPRGLVVASVVGPRGSIRLVPHALWDSWAWDTKTPSLWFHRIVNDVADTDWPYERRLSRRWFWSIDDTLIRQVNYELRGTILPAPVGGSVLVRDYGSYEKPAAPVVILEPDGRIYPLADQHAFIASDGYHPFAADAQWSPDGRHVLLAHPQFRGTESAFVVYDRNASQHHIGIGSQASFDTDGDSIYYVSRGALRRSSMSGGQDTTYRPIPTRSSRDAFLFVPGGQHLVSLTGWDELIATLTKSDSAFIRSWVADARPLPAPDGSRLLYPRGEWLLMQELSNGQVQRVSEIVSAGHFSWSPDGRWIAVSSPDGLKVLSTESSGRAALITPEQQLRTVQWSPDSRFIAVLVDGVRKSMSALSYDGLVGNWIHGQLRIYERQGRIHRIWRVLSGCDHLAWSSDSQWIAYGGPGGCA